ncbi:MAG: protease modulator HflC [Candidatus Omnitrophica bacterium]|nr:protease modulator HflC [Candidatus Omnitrophota bacterium]MCF7893809.1 protease modulator HflC [Candidatus Omnitrophota bacterium]
MKQSNAKGLIALIIVILLILIGNPFYTLKEGKQVVITQFGDPIGDPITKAGLHLKIPFIQKVNTFEKRVLEWDGDPNQIPTKDKRYIKIDTTARWRIVDALKFFQSVYDEVGAHARLDDVVDAAVRDVITSHNLVEIVRSSNRILENFDKIKEEGKLFIEESQIEKVRSGRNDLRTMIISNAKEGLRSQFGIELLDVRIKRLNYVEEVQRKVYDRMISERKRAAEEYRSEGRGAQAEITGKTDKELKLIQSEAYKKAQKIKGKADAKATKIYADAYSKDPDFYSFLQTLKTYQNTVDSDTALILTTDAEYFKYLQKSSP